MAMRPAWANASVPGVNLFSELSPGHGLALSSLCSTLDTAQEVGGCGQVWELKVFYQLAGNPLHSINTCCREFFVARLLACWPAILLRGRIVP